jgi:hypothetical protein
MQRTLLLELLQAHPQQRLHHPIGSLPNWEDLKLLQVLIDPKGV